MFRPDRASKIIGACACLHNFAVEKNENWDEELDEELIASFDASTTEPTVPNAAAVTARNEIVRMYFSS